MAVIEQPLVTETSKKAGVSDEEWALRVKLAACYRIFNYLGWTELIFNHISLRVPGPETHLLINPFGLRYCDVTASNLVKIDLQGNIIGDDTWPVNRAGVIIHTALHAARPDIHAVMHTHTTAGSAVAGLDGPIDGNNFYASQLWGQIRYHDFEGITLEKDEQDRLVENLGEEWLLVLHNHGLLSAGATLESAFMRLWTLERSCEIQVATMSTGGKIKQVSDSAHERSSGDYRKMLASPEAGLRAFEAYQRQIDEIDPSYRT